MTTIVKIVTEFNVSNLPLPLPLTLFCDEIVGRATPPLKFAFSASESLYK